MNRLTASAYNKSCAAIPHCVVVVVVNVSTYLNLSLRVFEHFHKFTSFSDRKLMFTHFVQCFCFFFRFHKKNISIIHKLHLITFEYCLFFHFLLNCIEYCLLDFFSRLNSFTYIVFFLCLSVIFTLKHFLHLSFFLFCFVLVGDYYALC